MPRLTDNNKESLDMSYMYLGSDVGAGTVDADDWSFKSLTQSTTDLPNVTQDRQYLVSAYLYQSNPFAHRYVDLLTAFTMGEGPVPLAAEQNVQDVIDEFWKNEHNDWEMRSIQFARELSIYGTTKRVGLFTIDR